MRGVKDVPYIDKETPKDEVVKRYNELVDEFNFLSKNMSLSSNFNGQILETTISAGDTKTLSHNLGIVPLYRIILRQVGNGVITDVPSDWKANSIKLKNNGSEQVTLTILLVRE